MSRSRKKLPIVGNTVAKSEKQDKRQAHKAFRAKVRRVLSKDPESDLLPEEREVSDPYLFSKDGKQYVKTDQERARRK
jgi:hypothetical protein